MKRIILITALLFTGLLLQAQHGSWKVKVRNITLLETRTELPEKNVYKIKARDWKKSGYLEIIFTEDEKNEWYRTYHLTDELDNDILRKDTVPYLKISLAELRKLFKGKKKINIYTTISPVDPNLAIRIRRVHLFTLQLP